MIKVIPDLPANVFGYSVEGELTAKDYRIIRPHLKNYASRLLHGINLLVDVTRAKGMSTRAFWEEAKVEWEFSGEVQRVALVGAPFWTTPFVKLADMLSLGKEVKTFDPTECKQAVAWLTGVVGYQ